MENTPDNQPNTPTIEAILEEITRTLASYHKHKGLRHGIEYQAKVGDNTFTLTFVRNTLLDGQNIQERRETGSDMDNSISARLN